MDYQKDVDSIGRRASVAERTVPWPAEVPFYPGNTTHHQELPQSPKIPHVKNNTTHLDTHQELPRTQKYQTSGNTTRLEIP